MAALPFPAPAEADQSSTLTRARENDGAWEFERLYRTHAPRLRGFVRRRAPDPSLADDVVQETLLRAYNAGIHLEGSGEEWGWLSTVARRLCIDLRRSHRFTAEYPGLTDDAPVLAGVADHHGDPPTQWMNGMRRRGIAQALEALPERQRRMLAAHLAGTPPARIAANEGISSNAAKLAVSRARRAFREHYLAAARSGGFGGTVITPLAGAGQRLADRLASARQRVSKRWVASPRLAGIVEAMAPLSGLPAIAATAALGATAILGGPAAGQGDEPPPRGDHSVTLSTGDPRDDGGWLELAVGRRDPGASEGAPAEGGGVDSRARTHLDPLDPPAPAVAPGPATVSADPNLEWSEGERGRDVYSARLLYAAADLNGDGRETEDDVAYTSVGAGFTCAPPGERGVVSRQLCPVLLNEPPPEPATP